MEVHVLAVMKRNVTIYKHVSNQTDVTSKEGAEKIRHRLGIT